MVHVNLKISTKNKGIVRGRRKFLRDLFCIVCLAFVLWGEGSVMAQDADFAKAVRLADLGKTQEAYEALQSVPDNMLSVDKIHLKFFALGKWSVDLKKWEEGRKHLQYAMKHGSLHAAHIYYLIGRTYKEEGDWKQASETFRRALNEKPSQILVYQIRSEMSEAAVQAGKFSQAMEQLSYLERRWRGTPNYSDIVWRLMNVQFKDNRRHLACRWARKIYARYPTHPEAQSWGIHLEENKIGERSIGCLASHKDVRDRLRHLALAGQIEKARAEIDKLRAGSKPEEKTEIDMLLVSHLEGQGFPDEAFKILIPYYEEKKNNLSYQSLLGKVAGRAGEYQTAVGAFYNVYRLSPRSRSGREALFTSAFMSYQIQDYDGAYRKFQDMAKKYGGSKLARDASWHMAWLQYLKADYVGAEKSFRKLLNERYYVKHRRRRSYVVRPFMDDRTKYWLAMALVKQEKYEEARKSLMALANDKYFGYYSFVAKNRLVQIEKLMPARSVTSIPATATTEVSDEPGEGIEGPVESSPAALFSPGQESADDKEDGDEETPVTGSEAGEDGEDGEVSAGPKLEAPSEEKEEISEEDAEQIKVTAFKDPRLRERFQKASNLTALGFREWAKWELFEIERRTSNKTYLKMLMEAYDKIGSYNRVQYISEIYFSTDRAREGLKKGRELWQYNFPQAYGEDVQKFSKKFNVSPALVLSIMRAESQFNKDAYSPVGARGLMQIMPYTAEQLTKLLEEKSVSDGDLLLPEINIRLGTRYLSRLQKKFQEQIPLVAAAYNAGPHRVYGWLSTFGSLDMDEFIEHVPFVETRNYMKKVVRNYALYTELYNSKPETFAWLTKPVPAHVSARPTPRENWELID